MNTEQQVSTEAEFLRRTLLALLLENEALKSALSIHKPAAAVVESDTLVPTAPTVGLPIKFSPEKRRLAVERYRQKRKRRLEQPNNHQIGPRYAKMKAVADGKRRNACGKFVKKSELKSELVEELVEEIATLPLPPPRCA